jgi:hypothetical protein
MIEYEEKTLENQQLLTGPPGLEHVEPGDSTLVGAGCIEPRLKYIPED